MRMSIFGMAMPLVVMAGLVNAQERRAPGDATRPPAAAESRPAAGTPGQAGNTAQASQADQQIAAVKLAMCRNEVELAKLASQKAQSDEVKQFAAKMVKEHTEGCAKLEKVAGAAGNSAVGRNPRATAFGDAATRSATPDAADRAAQPAVRPGAAAPGSPAGVRPGADLTRQQGSAQGLDWVSIHQEIAQQCLASAKQELEKKEGAEFDKCYIGMAIASHQHAVDADHVFMNHSSPQFQGEVEECLKTATSHLNEAKDIMESLAGKPAQETNRK